MIAYNIEKSLQSGVFKSRNNSNPMRHQGKMNLAISFTHIIIFLFVKIIKKDKNSFYNLL